MNRMDLARQMQSVYGKGNTGTRKFCMCSDEAKTLIVVLCIVVPYVTGTNPIVKCIKTY